MAWRLRSLALSWLVIRFHHSLYHVFAVKLSAVSCHFRAFHCCDPPPPRPPTDFISSTRSSSSKSTSHITTWSPPYLLLFPPPPPPLVCSLWGWNHILYIAQPHPPNTTTSNHQRLSHLCILLSHPAHGRQIKVDLLTQNNISPD